MVSGASPAICILGMHRSGTSAISRILSLLGVHLGAPSALLEPFDDNPKGYWEHSRIVQINDDILGRFGGRWNVPPVFPDGWAGSAEVADLRDTARQLVATEFAGQPLWGWKDPRTCLTLPFWQEVIGPVRYLLVVRNPAAVVASLYKRDRMSALDSEGLWLAYLQASLTHTAGHPRSFVFFDDLLGDLTGELRRLAQFIGRPEVAEDPGLRRTITDFIENELWHHRRSAEDLIRDAALSFEVKGLYLAILAHAAEQRSNARQPEAAIAGQVDLLADEALRAWTRARALAAEREAIDRERMAQNAAHHQLMTDYSRVSSACERLSAEVEQLNAERDRLSRNLQSLDDHARAIGMAHDDLVARERHARQVIAQVDAALAQAAAERDHLARMHQALSATLREIEGSFAWNVVGTARGAIVNGLPAGTRRRRLFDAALRSIVPPQPGNTA